MKKYLLLSFLVTFSIACSTGNSVNFISCEFISGLGSLADLECGKFMVPENHDSLEGNELEITYVIIRSSSPSPSSYPLIYLTGGPGGASLTSARISSWMRSSIREKRDIILLDQRGIGYSSGLPNINRELFDIMAEDASDAEEQIMMSELLSRYRVICDDKNIRLEFYNTFQIARDVGMLMKTLGYEKYNIYGTSYGTRLARVVQDFYPELLNAVILNSPNPLTGDLLIDRLYSYSLALERVFAFCENDSECQANNPRLREEYLNTITSLKASPLEIEVRGEKVIVNAQDGVYFLRRKLYANDSRSVIPELIKELKAGGGPILERLIANEYGLQYNFTMWLAVERYEMYSSKNSAEVINDVYLELPLLPAKLGMFSAAYQAMPRLHDAMLPEGERIFQKSSVPTLITVNYYDPVTPPENGRIIMRDLSKGQLFILDEGGHGGGALPCRNKVMTDFMDDPEMKLDISCLKIYKAG